MYNSYTDPELIKKPTKISTNPISIYKYLSPAIKIERSFSILKRNLNLALQGGIESAVHVLSADAGTGKTTTVFSFIADWKARSFSDGSGIVVTLGTLAEIDTYVAGCKLDMDDYAVLSSNPAYNAYGIGRSRAREARVLFTPHEQFRRRVMEAGSFAGAERFKFMSAPRGLIIWDEGFLPAQHAAFTLNDLQALPAALSKHHRATQIQFEALLPDRADRVAGGHIVVSYEVAKLAGELALTDKPKLSDRARLTLEAISKLGGSKAFFRGDDASGWSLIGRGRPLPSDMPPMFVLDASARLTGNYDQLRDYGFDVVQMEPAQVSYADLDIEWWDKGCGRTVLSTAKERSTVIAAVAELVNSKPDESWLIVHRKDFGQREDDGSTTIPDDLQKLISEPERVRSVTWGRHLGSNAFRDIPNVIVMGSYGYSAGAYDALHLAVSGQSEGEVTTEQRRAREDAEFCHNLYQAVCRSRVRQQHEGVCAKASAYFIMTRNNHREALVARCFPDSTVRVWEPVELPKKSKTQHVIHVLETQLAGRTIIRKPELIAACGSSDRSYLDKVLRSSTFKEYAKANGIVRKGGTIYRRLPMAIAA